MKKKKKIVRLTRGEKFLYMLGIFCFCFSLGIKVFSAASISNIKMDIEKISYKIDGQEKNYSDKEPSGTTRGLLDIIHMKNQNNILVVVVRYFGGVLLGSGGLTRAYTKVASGLFIE